MASLPPPVMPARRPAESDGLVARVMICDDSVVIRGALARMLEGQSQVQIVARVANGALAVAEVQRQMRLGTPIDVVVLDIEMPVMDGMQALPVLLRNDPKLRVVMASTLTTRGADIAMQALRLGAADYLPKPSTADIADDSFRRELIAKVVGLARMRARPNLPALRARAAATLRPLPRLPPILLAVGSSTGGPQALFSLVQGLGKAVPLPVVLTQHMPATFTPILADHLTRLGGMPCAEAKDGEPLLAGRIYLAPGDRHLLVQGVGGALRARVTNDPPENFCRPAVDPMLRSAAAACTGRVLVVMLTGMGQDGMLGTRAVVEAGGAALAQDEASSVVWGMPGAIAKAGLCHQVLPLSSISSRVLEICRVSPIRGAVA